MTKCYYVIGLTGQSGAGKTTVSNVFSNHGYYTINCDIEARKALDPKSSCVTELIEEFPHLFEIRILDRKKAAAFLFSNRNELEKYNSIIFPYIIEIINKRIIYASENGYRYILLDAPTLFEAGVDKLCDVIVSCVADEEIRLNRITKRDNISSQDALRRFSSQKSEKFFRDNSDYVIENNSDDINDAIKNTEKVIENITNIFKE